MFLCSFVSSFHICTPMVLSSLFCTFTVSVAWVRNVEGVHVKGGPDQVSIKQDLATAHLSTPLLPDWSKWRWPWAILSPPLDITAAESSVWAGKFNYTFHEEGKTPSNLQSS